MVMLLLCCITLLGCSNSADTYPQIEQRGTLRIGLDPTYPPFENLDDGGLSGIDVDLGNAIAAELGLTASFDYISYDGLYDALLTNRVDVLLSALIIDETRTKEYAYSEPYFNAGQVAVYRTGSAIQTNSQLDGATVAVELGAEGHVIATQLPNVTIQTYNTPDEALAALLNAPANDPPHFLITDAISGQIAQSANPQLALLPEPLSVEPFAAVMRIEDETLQTKVNQALNSLQQSGTLDSLIASGLK